MTADLAQLLHDAVADVEPTDRIDAIRARTSSPSRSAARPWFYAAGATVLATAATVAAFAVLGDDGEGDTEPAHHGHDAQTELVPTYYLGDTPQGLRLFREFVAVPAEDSLSAALDRIQGPADDPDYWTQWLPGSFESAVLGDGTIDVELGDGGFGLPEGSSAPGSAELALQQVVYTLQGAAQKTLPVRFLEDGQPAAPIGGHPSTVDAEPQNDVLSPISISDPAEGEEYSGPFTARGRANSFEGTVPWELRDGDEAVVREGFATAAGSVDRLYGWETPVDLSGLEPGTYTFVAMTSDPSGGAEGAGPFTDTRTIVVR